MKKQESSYRMMCMRMPWEHMHGLQDQDLCEGLSRVTVEKVMSKLNYEGQIELVR